MIPIAARLHGSAWTDSQRPRLHLFGKAEEDQIFHALLVYMAQRVLPSFFRCFILSNRIPRILITSQHCKGEPKMDIAIETLLSYLSDRYSGRANERP